MTDYTIIPAIHTRHSDGSVRYECAVAVNGHPAGLYYATVVRGHVRAHAQCPANTRRHTAEGYRSLLELADLTPDEIMHATMAAIEGEG